MQLQMKQITGLIGALKAPFTVSNTLPMNPVQNQVWLNPDTMTLYVYFVGESSSSWVEIQ